MTVLLIGRQTEALRRYRRMQIDDHAKCVGIVLAGAQRGDRRVLQRQLVELGLERRAGHVDDEPIGRGKGKYLVFDRAG